MKADELMEKYKRKHGNSWNFSCQMESVDENKRTFYSAEYLDVGLLRQVHTRNNLHHVYYESSCGTFGRYSALKLKRIKTINQLQLEFPQFLINKETFDYENGIIKNKQKFYQHQNQSEDNISANIYNKEFWCNYLDTQLTKEDQKIVYIALVECLLLYYFTQISSFLDISQYPDITKCESYKNLINLIKTQQRNVDVKVDKYSIIDLLFIQITRLTQIDDCKELPSNSNLVSLLMKFDMKSFKEDPTENRDDLEDQINVDVDKTLTLILQQMSILAECIA